MAGKVIDLRIEPDVIWLNGLAVKFPSKITFLYTH